MTVSDVEGKAVVQLLGGDITQLEVGLHSNHSPCIFSDKQEFTGIQQEFYQNSTEIQIEFQKIGRNKFVYVTVDT